MIGKLISKHVRREMRSGGYTDLVLRGIDAKVTGGGADALVTGALEVCAGMWGRVLAAAVVTGTDVMTPRVRHRLGRDLIRQGESVHLIVTDPLGLEPAFDWDVREDWSYRLSIPQPTGNTRVVTAPRDAVAHFTWATSPREPWLGLSPLEAAPALARLASRIEAKLGEDLATPSAALIPIPVDGGDGSLASLRADIGGAKGSAVLVEATSAGFDQGRQQAGTRHDWRSERLGPAIPAEMRLLYGNIMDAVATCCGIPAALIHQDADGTAQREAYRRFVMTSVQPIADMIAETASAALETDVKFDFSGLWAHDLQGRASAFQKLVAGGMDVAEAVAVAGLMVGE